MQVFSGNVADIVHLKRFWRTVVTHRSDDLHSTQMNTSRENSWSWSCTFTFEGDSGTPVYPSHHGWSFSVPVSWVLAANPSHIHQTWWKWNGLGLKKQTPLFLYFNVKTPQQGPFSLQILSLYIFLSSNLPILKPPSFEEEHFKDPEVQLLPSPDFVDKKVRPKRTERFMQNHSAARAEENTVLVGVVFTSLWRPLTLNSHHCVFSYSRTFNTEKRETIIRDICEHFKNSCEQSIFLSTAPYPLCTWHFPTSYFGSTVWSLTWLTNIHFKKSYFQMLIISFPLTKQRISPC